MKMTNFREWLESAEFYDKEYRYDMDRYAGDNPKVFAHWFPQGQDRLYIPFELDGNKFIQIAPNIPLPDYRDKLEAALEQHGFSLVDFRKGLVSPKNNNKRQQRIIPVLQQLAKQQPDLQELIKVYERAQIRLNRGMNNFAIAISQDPHDIALMTYDRPWKMTSCMRLKDDKTEGGAKWHQVYDEVRDGGLIAYLIEPDDKDIKKPYARVLLRRFQRGNLNIALCEETVYGLEIPGFKEAVKAWIDQHQPKTFGTFTRKGSEWSDTFAATHTLNPQHSDLTKENQPHLLDALQHTNDKHQKLELAVKIIAANKNFDQDWIKEVLKEVNNWFKTDEELAYAKPKIWNFYVPEALMEAGYDVSLIADIIKRYSLEHNLFYIKGQPNTVQVTEYLMPVLIQNMNHIGDANLLADGMEHNPATQTQEFVNHLPFSVVEELFQYVSNPNIQPLLTERMIKAMKKHLPAFAKKAQEGDESAIDSITDEWVNPILDKLQRSQVNRFMQEVKALIGDKLFNRLYGHTYR